MRMLVTVEFVDAGTKTGTRDVLVVNRNPEFAESGDIGLSLDEGKQILNFIQQEFITAQAAEITERARICPRFGSRLVLKDVERRRVHTLFGRIALGARRWVSRGCSQKVPKAQDCRLIGNIVSKTLMRPMHANDFAQGYVESSVNTNGIEYDRCDHADRRKRWLWRNNESCSPIRIWGA
jgi:hypothetical protein